MNERLLNEQAFLGGRRMLGLIAGLLREEEYADFLREASAILRDTLIAYDTQARRMEQRLRPGQPGQN